MKKNKKNVLKTIFKLFLGIVYVFIILLFAKHSLNYFYNRYVTQHYNAKDYTINDNILLTVNIFEPYIVHYNNANILYQNLQFEDAISEYRVALDYEGVPEERRCSMHINIALSMIGELPEDYDTLPNIDSSIELLENARDVLLEEDCATEDGDGHSVEAEILKEEIEKEIERLKKLKDLMEQQQQQQQDQQQQQQQNQNPNQDPNQNQNPNQNPNQDPNQNQNPNQDPNQNPDNNNNGGDDNKHNQPPIGNDSGEHKSRDPEDFEGDIKDKLKEIADEAYEERQNDLDDYDERENYDYFDWNKDDNGIW